MSESKRHFVQQQGFEQANDASCTARYPALMFQPRVVGIVVVVALVLQSAPLFLLLSALLWWNVLLPALNPFDALYNQLIAEPMGGARLDPAPPPRRFAQGMAGSFMLAIGICLLADWMLAAWILQGLLIVALSALIFGRFCLGSYVYYLLHGKIGFANRTLPWAHG
ncbi:MAG TPA: DUF4395 family protein [Geothermobacteraceae bacterium]|nr:DUF4395 family protein [Geothermobacteraceae bacterium]